MFRAVIYLGRTNRNRPMNFRHVLLSGLWACLLLSPTHAAEPVTVVERNPMRVGVFDNPPIVMVRSSAKPEGIALDVLHSVAAQESWRLIYVPGSLDELLKLLDQGKIDIVVGIAYSEERARRYRFNRESLLGNWAMVYRYTGAKINSLLDLKSQPVALLRGSIHSEVFSRSMKDFGLAFTPLYVDSFAQVLAAVDRGDTKAGVVNRTFGALNAHRYGDVVETGIVFNPVYVHYAAPKESDPAVLEALDRHLAKLKSDPRSTYHESLRRWLETRQVERFPPWLLWTSAAVIGLLALVMLLAGFLRYQVRRQTGALQREIEQRRLAQERLKHLAYHDNLTHLPNRQGFNEALAHALIRIQDRSKRLALLFIDVDRLKNVNDGLGHAAGDMLLQRVAERLLASLRSHDHISRFGGDEFVVIVSDIDNPKEPEIVAQRLMQSLKTPIDIGVTQVYVTASIGIALYPDDAQSVEDLLKNADTAMYQAKEQGGNRCIFYQTQQTQRAVQRLTTDTRLRQGFERDEMCLHYQPIVNLAERRIVAVESLLRWKDPQQGLILPASFIPIAEETGLIVTLGEWVLEQSCKQLRTWHKQGAPQLRMAVNVSVRQLEYRLVNTIERVLANTGLAPEFLELELTEGVMLVLSDEVRTTLTALRDMGVRLVIDDFGTGYSSLSYLKELRFHLLKIDRSFVTNIPESSSGTQIATTVLLMAQGLGLQTVAEGIETEQQYDFLRNRGCEYGQGNFIARPQAAAEISGLLNNSAATKGVRKSAPV